MQREPEEAGREAAQMFPADEASALFIEIVDRLSFQRSLAGPPVRQKTRYRLAGAQSIVDLELVARHLIAVRDEESAAMNAMAS
jgi:hypothetical protein